MRTLFLLAFLAAALRVIPAHAETPASTSGADTTPHVAAASDATTPEGVSAAAPATEKAKPPFGGTLQMRPETPDFKTMAMQTAKSCFYFFAGLLVLLSVTRRFKKQTATPEEQIAIVSRANIGPKSSLLVASVRGREFFLSLSGDKVALVAALDSNSASTVDDESDFEEYYEDEAIESKYRER